MIIFSTNETPFNIIFFNYGIFFPPDYTGKNVFYISKINW